MYGGDQLGLEEQVLDVLARWDRRLEIATAAWAELTGGEQRRREAELDADGESDEWVVVLWNWWNQARLSEQEQLRSDVAVLAHLLRALERMAEILGLD
jgi:hypothetical protein